MDYTRFKQRILKTIDRHGEQVTIGSVSIKVFLQPLDSFHTHLYLDDTEAQALIRPALFLIAGGDVNINVNDTLTRDGKIYTVRKVATERLAGLPVLRFAVLS